MKRSPTIHLLVHPHIVFLFALTASACLAACGEKVAVPPGRAAAPATGGGETGRGVGSPTSTLPTTGGLEPAREQGTSDLIVHNITEETFIDSPSRRDPFRSFLVPLTKQQHYTSTPQIESVLDQYQIDELKLVAIISERGGRTGPPMAMVEDPTGVGHILRRGNYVGKGEILRRVTSGEEVQVFWKVARIREDAVVFEREDPFSPEEATVTKILTLER